MLAHVGPRLLDAAQSSAVFEDGVVRVELVHATRPEWTIWAMCDAHGGIAGVGPAHEHFDPYGARPDDAPWTSELVDFMAMLLRGELELEVTFRGDALLSVRTHAVGGADRRAGHGYTAYFPPGRLLVWRRKRTVVERPSFL